MNNKEEKLVIKGPKGEFDVSTPEGRAQAEGYMKALSELTGRLANEKDKLQREAGKRYDLKGGDLDLAAAKKTAAEMRSNGADDAEIDAFWSEFSVQSAKQAAKGNQFDVFWAEYKAHRPELFQNLSQLDQDLYKRHVKESYLDRLDSEADQFQFLDQVFEDKIRRASNIKPASSVDDLPDPAPYVEGGSRSVRSQAPRQTQHEVDPEEEEHQKRIQQHLEEFAKY